MAAILAGCGGDDAATESSPAVEAASGAEGKAGFITRAEEICLDAAREIETLAARFLDKPPQQPGPLGATTEQFVKPGIAILEREQSRLEQIEARPEDPDLERFIGLFDPILVLSERRLSKGKEGDPDESRELEVLISELGDSQKQAARRFGLRVCGFKFTEALTPGAVTK